jgi:uncharacterized membrane protein YeaQ/YmgE (transglycosylase-associated protein family)
MNIVVWILAGGIVGWLGHSFLRYNEYRGLKVSIIIGTAGGFLGGKLIAPLFSAAAAVPGDFSASALLFAGAAASACLFVGNVVHERWGI